MKTDSEVSNSASLTEGGSDSPGTKMRYAPPEFSVGCLRLVTLGGSPGNPDSGSTMTEDPLVGQRAREEEMEKY